MRDESLTGWALVLAAIAATVTMAFHPTGGDLLAAGEGATHVSRIGVLTHALALTSFPVALLGAIGLSRHLAPGNARTVLPVVVYATGVVAAVSATVGSGLVGTRIAQEMVAAEGVRYEAWSVLFSYTGMMTRAFTGVFVVASSVAVLLWSVEILIRRAFPLWMGVAGSGVSILILVTYLSGLVRLDVHGLGVLVLAQSAWFIAAGVLLIRGTTRPEGQSGLPPDGRIRSTAPA